MKSKDIAMVVLLMLLPAAAMAQQHIREAFDQVLATVEKASNKEAEIVSCKKSLEKDPETGKKLSQQEVNEIIVYEDNSPLFSLLQSSFQKDRDAAYSMSSGKSDGRSYTYVTLAVGDAKGPGVAIGKIPNSSYIYALFMDKDDSEKKYRYAYGMEWKKEKAKNILRLIVTYATTLKYREGQEKLESFTNNFTLMDVKADSAMLAEDAVLNWLAEFNMQRKFYINMGASGVATVYATEIYKLCRDVRARKLSAVDRQMVSAELQKLKDEETDTYIQKLFEKSLKLME